ncbi:hypothetical protein ACN38_g5499, partial [Penicillium nordicum]
YIVFMYFLYEVAIQKILNLEICYPLKIAHQHRVRGGGPCHDYLLTPSVTLIHSFPQTFLV